MAAGDQRPQLLTERIARWVGLERLAAGLGIPNAGAYLFPLLGAVIDFGVLSGISYLVYGRENYATPTLLAIPVGLMAAVFLTRWVRGRYQDAVENVPGDALASESLLGLPTGRLRVGLFVLFYVGNLVQLLTNPAEVSGFVDIHGPAVAWTKYIVASLFYYVVYADVAAMLAAGMLLLPLRIYRSKPDLDFSDVRGFAGLYEVSRLLQAGAIVYFIGIAAWTAFLYLPSAAEPVPEISPLEQFVFPALWLIGIVLYLGPVVLLHRFISAAKEAEIARIDDRIREFDPDGEGKGLPYLTPRKEDIPLIQQRALELQRVRNTREYPANVSIVEELVLAALVPLAFQWGLRVLLGL